MAIPESTKKDSRQSWVYLSFVSVITFFVFGFLDAYGVLLVFLVQHFKEKNSKAGWCILNDALVKHPKMTRTLNLNLVTGGFH